jgi:hypothetical protein
MKMMRHHGSSTNTEESTTLNKDKSNTSFRKSEQHHQNKAIRWFVHSPSVTVGRRRQSASRSPNVSDIFRPKRTRSGCQVKPEEKPEESHPSQARIGQLERELEEALERVKALQEREADLLKKPTKLERANLQDSGKRLFPEDLPPKYHEDSPSKDREDSPSRDHEEPPTALAFPETSRTPTGTPGATTTADESFYTAADGSNALAEKVARSAANGSFHRVTSELSFSNHIDYQSFGEDNASDTPSAMWQKIAFESNSPTDHSRPPIKPPTEVVAICEQALPDVVDEKSMPLRLKDAEQRAQAYRSKLEKAEDLVASLFRDLDRARRSIHTLVSRNVVLTSHIKGIKMDREDNTIHRASLIKACMYVCPVFILCGGFEAFLSTIILVWVLVEIESSFDMDAADDDEEDEDEEEDDLKPQDKKPKTILKRSSIPKDILLQMPPED